MKRVIIIQEQIPHYRIAFFELLKANLAVDGIALEVICSRRGSNQLIAGELHWATAVKIRRYGRVAWHGGIVIQALRADLVIAGHELKYLASIVLQYATRLGGPRFAYWGHGRNFQARNRNSWVESIKRIQARHVDWWFAYNELSARGVNGLGFPAARITSVGNAIDTTRLVESRKAITAADLAAVRNELALNSENVAIYTGGLYPLKRIEFLIKAAILIRKEIPDFELIVIGDGPERHLVQKAATMHAWIHDVGPKNDTEKVPYWAISKVLLMPGGVGLVILDSFALGVPMVTTDTKLHGPEIDYLIEGDNGVLVRCGESVEIYAMAVIDLMRDEQKRQRIANQAMAASADHTIERMVCNFAAGVRQALEAPKL